MTELKNNKIFLGLVALVIFNVVAIFGFKLAVDKVTDKVIQRLQKEYSPSPYGPGFDPDKVDIDKLKGKSDKKPQTVTFPAQKSDWRNDWESNRGFNHE